MNRFHSIRICLFMIAACAVLTALDSSVSSLLAQELVPVTSRRKISWGSSGRVPAPVLPFQEDQPLESPADSLPMSAADRMSAANPMSAANLEVINLRPVSQSETQDGIDSDDQDLDVPFDETPINETAGRLEVITQRYPDGKVQIKRQVMQDDEGNYLNQGPWKLFSLRGQVMAEGQFDQGRMDGSWQRWHPADSQGLFSESPFNQYQGPFLSVATYRDGQLDGTWTIFDRMRRKILEISYADGKRDGRAFWYWPNSTLMREVDFSKGEMHGPLTEYDRESKPVREATYDRGQELVTRTSFFFKDQKRTEHNFLGPKMEFLGQDDWWNAEPAQYETVGQEVQHGLTHEWYSNGQIRLKGQYKDGLRTGRFVWWHENGQKQIQGSFVADLKSGLWTWWHANGVKAIEGNYENDLEVGIWTWWTESREIEDQRDFDKQSGYEELETLQVPDEDSDT